MKNRRVGFTLIELMLVVAIIGILASIAIPKFSQLIIKSNEAATMGSLGTVRSAISAYYSDNEGVFPNDTLGCLSVGSRYLQNFPSANLPQTPNNTGHDKSPTVTGTTGILDQGGWLYNNNSSDSSWGRFMVACTHSDLKGNVWTSY